MKRKVIHSFHWYNSNKQIGYCNTCRKEIKANTAFHFNEKQQGKLYEDNDSS